MRGCASRSPAKPPSSVISWRKDIEEARVLGPGSWILRVEMIPRERVLSESHEIPAIHRAIGAKGSPVF